MNTFHQLLDLSLQSMGIIPILAAMLLVVLAVSIERFAFFARIVPSGEALDRELSAIDHREQEAVRALANRYRDTVFGTTLQAAVDARHLEPDAMDRYIDEAIVRTLPQLDRALWMLDAAITLGPLIGLLGTIIGITESFNVLGTSASNVGAVTGGIGHALFATGCGLAVAIVGVAFNGYFGKRVRLAVLRLDLVKHTCINRLWLEQRSASTLPFAAPTLHMAGA
ncbi:MotA/TolQ/ExbB proton channel family protein [Paraburkholderia kururiensis]|uniref:MotA/TolQ/ExbB proton channel family protein n=1 Tax=Paraburkholderia kururiensis TaxID=984307 RepID=UPI0005A8C233|nr:MotA/TolQ/ExbB proton channel family protein [Paraburkholderia kururiensis]